ncbi:MAG: hypothetical protein K8E24_012175 [Methanobacterium paludis]|nr:hypothetical protein [Methanobacterium paludis]
MLKFIAKDELIRGTNRHIYQVLQIEPEAKLISTFLNKNLAGDYVDFLNDKYVDKEINQEWPTINKRRKDKIPFRTNQIIKEW